MCVCVGGWTGILVCYPAPPKVAVCVRSIEFKSRESVRHHVIRATKARGRTDEVVAVPVQVPLLPKRLLRDPEGDPVPEELLALVFVSGKGLVSDESSYIPVSIHPPTHKHQQTSNPRTCPWIRNLSVAVIWSAPTGLCDHSAPFFDCRSGVSLCVWMVEWGRG